MDGTLTIPVHDFNAIRYLLQRIGKFPMWGLLEVSKILKYVFNMMGQISQSIDANEVG